MARKNISTERLHTPIKAVIKTAIQAWSQGQFSDAEYLLSKAISSQPDNIEIYINLGRLKQQQGKLEEALNVFQRATQHFPKSAIACKSVGDIFLILGQLESAIQHYAKALHLNPDFPEVHNNIGIALKLQERYEVAIKAYTQAIKCKPDYIEAYYNLANTYHDQGCWQQSLQCLREGLKIAPNHSLLRFSYCINQLPGIYSNSAEILERRTAYSDALKGLLANVKISSQSEQAMLVREIGKLTPFYLAYQGLNDKQLQADYGNLLIQLATSAFPQWSQPVTPRKRAHGDKPRIGFVSGFFYNHSVWKMPLRGWLQNLDKSHFELFGYYIHRKKDQATCEAKEWCDHFVQSSYYSLEQWCELISQDQLDILIYPELSMEHMTAKLACLRLAPVQVTTWGHPITSGLPTIDYYLSTELMEPENGQEHYTESLIRLPNLGISYSLLDVIPKDLTRADLRLSEQNVIFWCCQSLYKYLPQHDDVFPRIASQLGTSKFLFIRAPQSKRLTDIFYQRLVKAFKQYGLDAQDFCIILPRLSMAEFAGATAISNVFLDSIGWSGCNTVMESTRFNLPVVTWPGKLMRSRHAAAILRMLEIEETIASSKEDYIQCAVRLGKDQTYRQIITQQITNKKHRLYNDRKPIEALQQFLLKVTQVDSLLGNDHIKTTTCQNGNIEM